MLRFALWGIWLAFAPFVIACPMCASGGPADYVKFDDQDEFAAVRKINRWLVGLDARTISSTEGKSNDDQHRQSQVACIAAFRPDARLFFFARVPYTSTMLQEAGQSDATNRGIGDVEILASYEFKPQAAKWWPAVSLGIKLPTGDNNCQAESEHVATRSPLDHGHSLDGRLDEHGQVGTGGLDGMIMAHLRRGGEYSVSSTVGYRINGENDYNYQYGSVAWLDLVVSRAVFLDFTAGLGSRLRYSERNTYHNVEEFHSGGTILFLMPEVGYSFAEGLNLAVLCTLPVVNELNGLQSEKLGLSIALTKSF